MCCVGFVAGGVMGFVFLVYSLCGVVVLHGVLSYLGCSVM